MIPNKQHFLALGLEPAGNAPDEFGEFIKTQNARYGSVVKQANVRLDCICAVQSV